MSTRRTSPKDSQPENPDEKPFLDLGAINERILADGLKKSIAEEIEREGKLPQPAKRDPKRDAEYEKRLNELFGEPIPRKR